MKVWARTRPSSHFTVFNSPNISHAVSGFRELGAEIVTYNSLSEIYDYVTKEDIVLDGINQCLAIFDKFGVHPYVEDYPQVLKPYLGRRIWKDNIDSISRNPNKWGIFVKPVKEKAFTGKVINSPKDLIGCGSCYENYEVLCSDVLDIKREWRGFIYYDKLIDIRPYTGDYHYSYDSKVIDKVLESFKTWKGRPVSCSLDFAVVERKGRVVMQTEDGLIDTDKEYTYYETIFLEANDAFALGNYGLNHIDYAKLISARWSQLLDRHDEYLF